MQYSYGYFSKRLIKWPSVRNRRRPSRSTQVSCRLVIPSSYKFKYHADGRVNTWREVISAVNKYDKELCEGWSKDIDSTLLFVGPFSSSGSPFFDNVLPRLGYSPQQ
jgi:hypothetical protein